MTQVYRDALAIPLAQDVHISCPAELMETLVTEFELKFASTSEVSVYDYGYSSRFRQGFIMVSWDGRVPANFLAQLDADPRLEGYTIYDLPKSVFEAHTIIEHLGNISKTAKKANARKIEL